MQHTVCTQNAHNLHTHRTQTQKQTYMQHIHINTEQDNTEHSTENNTEQTQYPDTSTTQAQPQHRTEHIRFAQI